MSEEEEFWNRALDTLAVIPGRVQRVIASGLMPSSKAAAEKESLVGDAQRQKFLDQLPPRAFTNILVIGEGVEGVTRLLRMPPIEVMPAPVGRAGLISSGLILWLTDPTIQPQNRVGRIIRVLADDLKNARKVANKGKSIARGHQAKQ